LKKVCNIGQDDWDLIILVVIWDYRTICKKLTGQTPFRLAYGKEVVIPMEFLVSSLCIVAMKDLTDSGAIEERLSKLLILEEDRFVVGFHHQVQKACEKSWHDMHIKNKNLQMGDIVLLYDSNLL